MSSPEMERLMQRLKEAYEERQAMTPEERAAFDERHRPMRERMQAEQGPGGTRVISEADDEEEESQGDRHGVADLPGHRVELRPRQP